MRKGRYKGELVAELVNAVAGPGCRVCGVELGSHREVRQVLAIQQPSRQAAYKYACNNRLASLVRQPNGNTLAGTADSDYILTVTIRVDNRQVFERWNIHCQACGIDYDGGNMDNVLFGVTAGQLLLL